jgi:L-aminopeptidase/D-esterase-like protein
MLTCHFKGGVGTSSRLVEVGATSFTIGVLVQSNFGRREDLLIDGVPVGLEMIDELRLVHGEQARKDGSIIVVIGTDAPLADRQLKRLCRRAMLGLSRAGGMGRHSSGDIMIAFSNAPDNRTKRFFDPKTDAPISRRCQLVDQLIDPFFQATIEATSEAVANALVAAETIEGRGGNTAYALPHDRLVEIMRRYGRAR